MADTAFVSQPIEKARSGVVFEALRLDGSANRFVVTSTIQLTIVILPLPLSRLFSLQV
jgi:hypothetical protein